MGYLHFLYLPIKYLLITKRKKKVICSGEAWQTPSESSDQSNIAVVMEGYSGNHDCVTGCNEKSPVSLLEYSCQRCIT